MDERTPEKVKSWFEYSKPVSCPMCQDRGWPESFGSRPKCAFCEDDVFNTDNWMCATMLTLRDLVEYNGCNYGYDDQYVKILPIDTDRASGFIVMSVYKSRGRTERAYYMPMDRSREICPLTLQVALAAIDEYAPLRSSK